MLLRSCRPVARRCARQLHTAGLLQTLEKRGFLQQLTFPEEFKNAVDSQPQTVYAGIDPSASSLHIGHLIPLLCLLHFQTRGHNVISLIGGATGLVGDPSGRKTERELPDVKKVEENVNKLGNGVRSFFANALTYASKRQVHDDSSPQGTLDVLSNLEWHKDFGMLQFLQTVGVNARVNTMLNRESVRSRLDSKQGMSFTEFTYQLLQAYDFYYLHKHHSCTVQVGGSDQWGNITAGLELMGRLDDTKETASPAFGFTTPLLTTASGEKFGKSAGNAVWLDSELTSVFDFYQYFLKVEDIDVEKYLKLFTLLTEAQIEEVMVEHTQQPEQRIAQRLLASEVTEMIHTTEGVEHARRVTESVFRAPQSASSARSLNADDILAAFKQDPRLKRCEMQELTSTSVTKLASKYGLVPSTSAARQLVQSKGLYLNDKPITEVHYTMTTDDLLDGSVAVIRAGKDKIMVLTTA